MASEVAALELDASRIPPTPAGLPEAMTDPFAVVGELIEATQFYLGADAAYVGEFSGNRQIFHWIAGDAAPFGLRPGASLPTDETICHAVMSESVPPMVSDTANNEIAASLGVVQRAGIRAFASAPIILPDGSVFGTLCAVKHEAASWHGNHERFMRLMSRLMAGEIKRVQTDTSHRTARMERIRAAARATQDVRISLQPIVSLRSRVVVGEEALARFPDERPPALWFAEAWEAGFGLELELATMRAAMRTLDAIPSQIYLSLNASPATLLSPRLEEILGDVDLGRIVLELTEHRPVDDYEELGRRLQPMRDRGMRLAIDDAGAGFANLRHVLQLQPDLIKLDISLTRGIEFDAARQALASSLMAFGARIGAGIIAEGIDSERQLEALKVLGIGYGQGNLLGAPGHGIARHLPHAVELGPAWPESLPTNGNPHTR